MKNRLRKTKQSTRQTILAVLAIAVTSILGVTIIGSGHAASGSGTMSLSPASGSYNVGDTITVTVYENSGTTNAVDGTTGVSSANVVLNYPQADLQFVSFDAASSGFNQPGPANSGGSGTVTYETNEAGSPLTNNQLVVKVNFKALVGGNATAGVTFNSASGLGTPNGNDANPTFGNASFTLVTPAPPAPPPTPPPAVTSTPAASTPATPAATTTKSTSTPSGVAVTPSGSPTPVTLPDNSNAQVSGPATIQLTQVANDPIVRAQYYLNGKLVATVTKAPYTYKLNTTNLRNGKYTLQAKTFYTSGKVTLTSEHIAVKNPMSFKQFFLQARHYAWILLLPLAVVLVFIYIKFIRGGNWMRPHAGSGGGNTPVDPDKHFQAFPAGAGSHTASPTIAPSGDQPTIIRPSGGTPIKPVVADSELAGEPNVVLPGAAPHAPH